LTEVVVMGGGTMGAGIAQCLLEAGATVAVVESSAELAKAASDRIETGLRRRYKVDGDTVVPELLARLATLDGPPADATPDLVIEAVPEIIELKATVLAEAERRYPRAAVLATNTSSLPIDVLAGRLERPERFCGMHFFNPVPRSELVELVIGTATAPEVVARAREWVDRLGKQSIEVRDSPGFATSRLGVCIGLEAMRMVEEGVASAEDIDRGMVLGYKFPIGPLELTDLVGLDVRLAIAEHLAGTLSDRFAPPQILRDKVAAGELGRKSGRGFYDWAERG
jgi:3-hydroxybutyryl-CoA dehydrogenase